MNIFDAISSSNDLVTGHIASNIFSVLPEDGPSILIVDRHGHRYTSEPGMLVAYGITEDIMRDLAGRVDDGYEPIIVKNGENTLVSTHLTTERCSYGHVMIVLKSCTPEMVMGSIAIVETILAQMNLVARLTERLADKHEHIQSNIAWATSCLN